MLFHTDFHLVWSIAKFEQDFAFSKNSQIDPHILQVVDHILAVNNFIEPFLKTTLKKKKKPPKRLPPTIILILRKCLLPHMSTLFLVLKNLF